MCKVITYDIKIQVQNRKYPVDIERLKECLISHKKFSNSYIAQTLNLPQTKVEHWFRRDIYFAIPDAEYWFELKDLLDIDTDEFDKPITCFEVVDCGFDMANRAYLSYGLCPTLDTGCDRVCVITDE